MKLEPCPFCNGRAEFENTDERARLRCTGCGTEGGLFFFSQEECDSGISDETEARAIAAWNQRASIPPKTPVEAGKVGDASGVPEAQPQQFPYDRTFQAIAAATRVHAGGVGIGISVKAFIDAWNAHPASGVAVGPTGREPELLQDCDRKLSRALAGTPDARLHAREAAAAAGVPACEAPDIHALIDRLDGYLNSPEQIALRDDLLAALRADGVGEVHRG